MATLSKRATPPQSMMLRIVEGAIKNACDAHGKEFDPHFARSVAKRAAGTLTAQMPEVLAAKPSEKLGVATSACMAARAARQAQLGKPAVNPRSPGFRAGGRHSLPRHPPLRSLEKWIVRQMREIKNSGNDERANAFIDILREISRIKAAP